MSNRVNLDDVIKFVSIFGLISLICGFLIWNIYLLRLGFFETNLIQTRYVLTGASFLFCYIAIFGALALIKDWLVAKFFKKHPGRFNATSLYVLLCGLFGFLIIYTLFIFPNLSQSFGGARPRVLALLASKEEMDYLANFGINTNSLQTEMLCVPYENDQMVAIFSGVKPDRILYIKKSELRGFSSLPSKTTNENEGKCAKLSGLWIFNEGEWK